MKIFGKLQGFFINLIYNKISNNGNTEVDVDELTLMAARMRNEEFMVINAEIQDIGTTSTAVL